MNLKDIAIILCDTQHPGNMGSAARAMKTMGLSRLILVNPKIQPDHISIAMAAGADDVLNHAKIFPDLKSALENFSLVFATSARERFLKWPQCSAKECAEKIAASSAENIAIVFGNERAGLSNEDLALAHFHITIPTVKDFSSLNLAAAVQIVAYEIYQKNNLESESVVRSDTELATHAEIEGLLEHFERTMQAVNFLDPQQPRLLLQRVQRLFMRAQLEKQEINILRGFLKTVINLKLRV